MRRIDSRTVDLNPVEVSIKDLFEGLLDDGLGIPQAAHRALSQHPEAWRVSMDFALWLSDDTVTMYFRRPKFTEFGRRLLRGR